MNFQQQAQLPVPADHLLYRPMPINVNNPPFVPDLPQLPQEVQSAIPWTAGAVANEIVTNADSNPLRRFMFNQMAENNFMNGNFAGLVNGVLEYAILNTMKGMNFEQALQQAVVGIPKAYACMNVYAFPLLQNFVTADRGPEVTEAAQWFNNISAEIAASRNRWTRAPMMQQQQSNSFSMTGFGGGNTMGAGGGWNQGGGMNQGPNLRGLSTTRTFGGDGPMRQPGQVGSGVGAKYSSTAAASPAVGNPTASTRTWASKEVTRPGQPVGQGSAQQVLSQGAFAPITVAAGQNTNQPNVQEVQELIPAKGNWHRWKPSEKYPYVPAFDPAVKELYFRLDGEGNLEPVLEERKSNVDYDRHALSSFGNSPAAQRLVKPGEVLPKIEKATQELEASLDAGLPSADNSIEIEKPIASLAPLDSQSLDIMIVQGDVERLAAGKGTPPEIFRAYGRAAEPIVVSRNVDEELKKYQECKTFEELKSALNGDVNLVPPNFWHACNRRATEMVNRLLNQNMSFPTRKLSIESFVEDITDLIKILGDQYGAAFQTAFLKHQAKFIRGTFVMPSETHMKEWTEEYLSAGYFEAGLRPALAFPCYEVSFTYLNCLSHELGVELAVGVGAVVNSDELPVLYKVLDNVFQDADSRASDITRHLIIMNDGRVLEAARGFLYEDVYLLAIIK